MAILRRKCKLTNSDYADVDLRRFEKTIIDTINNTVDSSKRLFLIRLIRRYPVSIQRYLKNIFLLMC